MLLVSHWLKKIHLPKIKRNKVEGIKQKWTKKCMRACHTGDGVAGSGGWGIFKVTDTG